ncbi:hypothetical protein A7A08_02990 [Methyloligella halotolerans]|uniref:DUF1254 domain-containing protein n=1 Tax=Methyloligella halotolerans TaxID=1177755 RepID=A0A1E2RV65_9HYPH|nr:hypothetical protein A7A08_02990 [Methyloligella halotolerans]
MLSIDYAFRALRSAVAPAVVLAAFMTVAMTVTPAKAMTQEDANAIATEAYLYFYSLVTMDLTRLQSTNVEKVDGFKGPANVFVNVPAYPTAEMKTVVRPNFDTLYSSAWLDLTNGALVVSVPDTGGRYYLMPILDMWTDVFASPGWRTTGTGAQTYLIAPPGWRPDLRDDLAEKLELPEGTLRVDAPTPYAWIIGRIKTDGPSDYGAVHKIQDGLTLKPLSEMRNADWKPSPTKIDSNVDMKTPPKMQVDTMSGDAFFTYAAELLKLHPPHFTDQPILSRMERLGIERGKSFDFENADPVVKKAIQQAPKAAQELMAWKTPRLANVVNGWSMNTDTMGVYGSYYLKRAIVTQVGLGANLPQDAVYPLNIGDKDDKPLDGSNTYTIHFDKDEIPPVDAFWSITLYGPKGYQVANSLDRFAVSSWMPFAFNEDGSLDLYFQTESPGKDKEANWLPAPKGPFNLTMRLYAPRSEALTGKWNPPPVTKAE